MIPNTKIHIIVTLFLSPSVHERQIEGRRGTRRSHGETEFRNKTKIDEENRRAPGGDEET